MKFSTAAISHSKQFAFVPTSMDGLSMKNTFIFNFIEKYDEKLHLLKTTFEHLSCNNCVELYDNLTYNKLKQVIDRLRSINFGLFEYIAVIILDNKTNDERFVTTKDNVRVLIQTEILTLLKTNKSLDNVPRLFVIQKLEDIDNVDSSDEYDDENTNETTEIKERVKFVYTHSEYMELKVIYMGPEFSIYANERSTNFYESPFIDVFCQEMLENSTKLPMRTIHSNINKRIKTELKYKNIDIAFGSNQNHSQDGILGKGLNSMEQRDFFN